MITHFKATRLWNTGMDRYFNRPIEAGSAEGGVLRWDAEGEAGDGAAHRARARCLWRWEGGADNNPPQVFLARLDGPLEDLEAWDARHGLCGCDACLDVILRVFLLMPFRRSNRRLVYNFLLTYYLLRCRLSVVRRGLLGGPDSEARRQSTPIVPWKTTEFVWTSLAQQRQLVRAGQARFRLVAEGRFHLDSESSRPSVAASST